MTRPILAIAILLPAALASADDRFAGVDPYVAAAMRRWEVPGVALAVVKDGEVVLARGYGLCELGTNRKVTPDTAFDIASCAKTFTAASLALLIDDGKLQWDDPVVKHLPEFQLADTYLTSHITIRDLLSHRTGLPRGDELFSSPPNLTPQEILRRINLLKPQAELRTKYIYSNAMYFVADQVLERASGQSWDRFIRQRIFKPLGMEATTFSVNDVQRDRLAVRHWRSDDGIVPRPLTASFGIHTTVLDMAKFLQMQLAEGEYAGQRIISQARVRDMQALQFSIPMVARPKNHIYAAQFYGSGLGWAVLDYRGHKILRHGGAWGAAGALVPDKNLCVVVLSNIDLEGMADMLTFDLLDAYLAGPEVAWDQAKWESTWLKYEEPGKAYRPRDEAKARLEKSRIAGTIPSLRLEQYAATYRSQLYGDLIITHNSGQLLAEFAGFTTPLSHWHHDAFYVRSPTRITYDWLLTFAPSAENQPASVTVKHVGWDKDEPDQVFLRIP
jgi:CubicO group peptidase (beta-lactamase class C family)